MGRHDNSSDEEERDRKRDKRSRQRHRDKRSEREAKGEVAKPTVPELNPSSDGNARALGKTGGVYVPPFKEERKMKEVEDKSSVEYQHLTWEALRKSINGILNKVDATNIKTIIPELFAENLIRGRGLFCRSCINSQMVSPEFTDVFAALVAVVNSKFPEVGLLLLKRVVMLLMKVYMRKDKHQVLAAVKFIAHLVNQQVASEIIALDLVTLLLQDPTDDNVELAVVFVKECGKRLQDVTRKTLIEIFKRVLSILHEREIDKRLQYLIEGIYFAKFPKNPAVRPELDPVEEQYSHNVSLHQEIDPETSLDVFKPDPDFLENEKKYEALKKELLAKEDDSDASSEDGDDEFDEKEMPTRDETETNLVNLRRIIYQTIMSSVDLEEACHKLLRIKFEPGQEMKLCVMLLKCCSQERTHLRYYGSLGQRFCMISKVYRDSFEKCFVQQYLMIHRLENNKLRIVARFFGHLLATEAIPWHVFSYIRLTKEDTTSSSRIFIKFLFEELSEHLGIRLLNKILQDLTVQESLESIFPKDNQENVRFSINLFTSIGLGCITDNLKAYLKNMQHLVIMQLQVEVAGSESGSSSGSNSSGSESDSESDRSSYDSESGSCSSGSEPDSCSSDSDSDSSSSSLDESDREKRKRRRRG